MVLLINLQPFFKITCGTNNRLKLTLQEENGLLMIEEGDEDAQDKKEDP